MIGSCLECTKELDEYARKARMAGCICILIVMFIFLSATVIPIAVVFSKANTEMNNAQKEFDARWNASEKKME